MNIYLAKAFSLSLYKKIEETEKKSKAKKVTIGDEVKDSAESVQKKLPNEKYRYFINHSEISFVSTSLEQIRDWIQNDACDWIEGFYFTHAAVLKIEEGYCPQEEVIEIYDVDTLEAPSKNWRLEKIDDYGEEKYIFKNMKGQEVAMEGYFGIDGVWPGSKKGYTFVADENRQDELIFVDPETGEENLAFKTDFANDGSDDELS